MNIINRIGKKVSMMDKKKVKLILLTVVFLVLLLLVRLVYTSYTHYRDTIVNQQQQHLLTIAKSISRSLELFVDEKVDSLRIIANNPEFQQKVNEYLTDNKEEKEFDTLKWYYRSQKEGIESVTLLSKNGKMLYQYPKLETNNSIDHQSNINVVLKNNETFISDAYEGNKGIFYIDVIEPIFNKGDFIGLLIGSINLDTMYELLVKPVKAGEKGYGMVKNREGLILMHPVKKQVGAHVIDTRREVYKGLDYNELEKLIDRQMTGEEGTAVYHSYWWPDNKLEKVKKLTGFSPAYIGNDFWVIAVPMSYEEVAGPIKENLVSMLRISLVFIVLLSGSAFIIIKMQENKEALEIETKYLKELNVKTDELRKSEVQLQHSQKIQTIGTLTGGIAHEFNNLLTPILGYSEIILNDLEKDSEWYEDIHEIHDASKKAKELIQQILIFSHRDKTITKYKPILIESKIRESIKLVRSLLPNSIKIQEEIDDCGYVIASAAQIHQIILNLCTNAYHAMGEREGLIEIAMHVVNKENESVLHNSNLLNNRYVKISIKDNGCGMDKETMRQVFDPFFTTKEVGKGTGLGLSVVHGIVTSHSGLITVESKLGIGTQFDIYLPLMNINSEEREEEFEILKGHENILLVDDDKRITKVIKKGLSKHGYNIKAETNPLKAAAYFKKNPNLFDLVILDQTMPEVKGVELAEKLKTLRPDIKIILITGYVDQNVETYINSTFIDGYLIKPILMTELSQKIRDVLNRA